MSALPPEFAGMSRTEKIELARLLLESVLDAEENVPDFHREIIQQRLDDLRRNPDGGQSLEEFVATRTQEA